MATKRKIIDVRANEIKFTLPEVLVVSDEENLIIPEWHKEIVLDRLNNPQPTIDAFEMIDELITNYNEI